MKLARRLHTINHELLERALHPRNRQLTRARVHNQLGEHRIVREPNLTPHLYPAIPPHPRPARQVQMRDAPGGWQESVGRILTRDAALDRPPLRLRRLKERQRLAAGDAQLPLHQINPHHEFRNRVLDLNARVHLEEVELAILGEQKLARPRIHVARSLRRGHGRITHPLPQLWRDRHTWRFLHHFLVAPLNAALALAECDAVSVRVGEDLNLHVARPFDVLLDVDRVVAEGVLRLALRTAECVGNLARLVDDAHPLSAAAGRGLEQHGVAKLGRELLRLLRVLQGFGRAGHDGRTGGDRQLAR